MTSSVLVNLDGHGPSFEVVGIVGRWNGWAIPRVTVEVAREIAKHLEREKDFSTAAEVHAAIHGSACADGTVTLNLGLTFFEVEAPEDEEEEGEGVTVPRSLRYATAVATSNLVRWAMTWAATEIARENERARAAQTSKRDAERAERAALVSEIRKRRAEADPAFAFQVAPHELPLIVRDRVRQWQPVGWQELEQIPIGGSPRFDVPTEGAVVAYAGRVSVVVQLRRPAGWDPVWCLLSLSGDVCGFTEAEPDDEQGKAARVAEVSR